MDPEELAIIEQDEELALVGRADGSDIGDRRGKWLGVGDVLVPKGKAGGPLQNLRPPDNGSLFHVPEAVFDDSGESLRGDLPQVRRDPDRAHAAGHADQVIFEPDPRKYSAYSGSVSSTR